MSKEDQVRLQHMRDAANEAIGFASGKTEADLDADRMRTLALTRCFEIVGEAAVAVSPETKEAHPDIPWRTLIAMRNRLIHAYMSVDTAILLSTTHHDLPLLVDALSARLGDDGFPPFASGEA